MRINHDWYRNESFTCAASIFTPKLFVWIHDHKTIGKDKEIGEGEIDVRLRIFINIIISLPFNSSVDLAPYQTGRHLICWRFCGAQARRTLESTPRIRRWFQPQFRQRCSLYSLHHGKAQLVYFSFPFQSTRSSSHWRERRLNAFKNKHYERTCCHSHCSHFLIS